MALCSSLNPILLIKTTAEKDYIQLRAFTGIVDHPRHVNPLLVQVHLVTGENRMTLQATELQASRAVVEMTEMMERITKEVQENAKKRAEEMLRA